LLFSPTSFGRSWLHWRDRRKQIELALGYVFVHGRSKDRLRVLQLPGVVRLGSVHGKSAPFPERDMEALRRGLEQNICAEPHPYLSSGACGPRCVGNRVHIVHGPLAGTEGILSRKSPPRVVISIDLLIALDCGGTGCGDVVPA